MAIYNKISTKNVKYFIKMNAAHAQPHIFSEKWNIGTVILILYVRCNYQLSKSPMTRISPLYVSVQILGMTFNWQLSMSSVLLFLMDLVDSYIYIPPLKFLWLFYSTKLLLLISNVIVQYERQHEKEPVLNGFGTKKSRYSNKIWLKLFISMPGKMRT